MQEYWYVEKNNQTNEIVAFEGRDELQKRIDASNQRREEGQQESQFYGYFSKVAAQEYKSRLTTNAADKLTQCPKCGADGELILLAWSIDIENDFDVYWEIECVCGESIRGDDASELCKKWAHLTTASA